MCHRTQDKTLEDVEPESNLGRNTNRLAKDAVAEDDAYQREAVAVRRLQQTKSQEKHSPKKLMLHFLKSRRGYHNNFRNSVQV